LGELNHHEPRVSEIHAQFRGAPAVESDLTNVVDLCVNGELPAIVAWEPG
jgi:hypothetical protein